MDFEIYSYTPQVVKHKFLKFYELFKILIIFAFIFYNSFNFYTFQKIINTQIKCNSLESKHVNEHRYTFLYFRSFIHA